MSNDLFTLSREDLTEHTNRGIDCLLIYLYNNGIITLEKFEEISQYRAVVSNKSMWSRLGEELWGSTKDQAKDKIIIVHVKD